MSSYSLEIISHHSEFKNKSLKKYHVDGIDTIGAWGNEPFEIRFKNHSWNKVQVKLSVDGTDILTGSPATTEVNKDMWVVQPYGTLNVQAWPETHNGGARFVFTSADNSVALHTHGDMTSRGIIAAAVFVEGSPAPVRIHNIHHNHYYNPYNWYTYPLYGGMVYNNSDNVLRSNSLTSKGIQSSSLQSAEAVGSINNVCSTEAVMTSNNCDAAGSATMDSMESLVAVGAGDHVEQNITYVAGLVKPVFTETLRVRYLWWDDLKSKLSTQPKPEPHASGFPGNLQQGIMSIGSTPRLTTHSSFRRAQTVQSVQQQEYTRF